MKKNDCKNKAKEEFETLSFNHVLLHKRTQKCTKLFFLSLRKSIILSF